jgi:hypothetical protein
MADEVRIIKVAGSTKEYDIMQNDNAYKKAITMATNKDPSDITGTDGSATTNCIAVLSGAQAGG